MKNVKEIGEKIRFYRKKSGITLKSLSQKTGYSIGKLSNIERGKYQTIEQEDIFNICKALNLSVSEIINPKREEEMNVLKKEIENATYYLDAGLYTTAKYKLLKIREEIEKNKYVELNNRITFNLGLLYIRLKKYIKAKQYFLFVLESETYDITDIENKVIAFNALAFINYKQFNYERSLEYINKSQKLLMKISDKINPYIKNLVMYNQALIQTMLGNYEAAYQSSLLIANNKIDSKIWYYNEQLLGFILLFNGNYETAEKHFLNSLDYFRREKDSKRTIHNLKSLYILYNLHKEYYNNKVNNFDLHIVDEVVLEEGNKDLIVDLISFFQCMAYFSIQEQDYQQANRLLRKCQIYEKLNPDNRIHFRTYYLYAELMSRYQDKKEEEFYLKKALTFLGEEQSIDKAIIHYQLFRLQGIDNELLEISDIFYNHLKPSYCLLSELKNLIPEPIL